MTQPPMRLSMPWVGFLTKLQGGEQNENRIRAKILQPPLNRIDLHDDFYKNFWILIVRIGPPIHRRILNRSYFLACDPCNKKPDPA